jgi:hypothetical protein
MATRKRPYTSTTPPWPGPKGPKGPYKGPGPKNEGRPIQNPLRKAARSSLKNAGITRRYLAKTTGTTKLEGGGLMSSQVKAFMTNSKIGAQSTQVTRRALSGGPSKGVKAQPAKAGRMVRKARSNYRTARRATRAK